MDVNATDRMGQESGDGGGQIDSVGGGGGWGVGVSSDGKVGPKTDYHI